MFDNIAFYPHPPVVLDHIESIQKDFLELAGSSVPKGTEEFIDGVMRLAPEDNAPETVEMLSALRQTKYQNPVYLREVAFASTFVVDCFSRYQPSQGIDLEDDHLQIIPYATVLAPAVTGFVTDMDILGKGQPKVPCIFISQNCSQTAWICSHIHSFLKKQITEDVWNNCIVQNKLDITAMPDAWSHVATESLRAFLCDADATGVGFYYRASDEDVEAGRLLVSYLMAHEYSHICLRHRARRNDDSPVALSSVRLRDLTEITEALSAQQRLQVPVSTDRLRYFFGYQQDELEADLLAFMVIYSRLRDHERSDAVLPLFFRQVGYSLLWGEISEVIGRTCKNGVSWLEEPLHNPDLCLLGDLAWRHRYPSAHSRLAYLHDRAKIGLDAEHLEIFEKEIHEMSMLGAVWRHILVTTSELLLDAARDDHPWSQAFRDSFVWKGMPQSVFGCVGYNDPTEAFRVYCWQDHLQA